MQKHAIFREPSDLYGFVVFFLRGGVAGFTQDLLENARSPSEIPAVLIVPN